MRRISYPKLLALLLTAVALLSGCSKSSSSTTESAFPAKVSAANGEVSIAAAPKRVVSLSPTATETLFAIGAAGQVVAVDDQSNFPADAPRTDLSGLTPNLEAITKYSPDLVVLSNDTAGIVDGLKKLGVPALLQTAAENLDDVYTQISALGQATGHGSEAEDLSRRMQQEIGAKFDEALSANKSLKIYHELDTTLYSATSSTFIGQIYNRMRLDNIADAADTLDSGYPQLSPEYVVQANPDLIFLADTKCCGQNAKTVAARPGWSKIKAVTSNGVIPLDDDIASRWGPRTVDLVSTIQSAVLAH